MMTTKPLWGMFDMDGVLHEAPMDKKRCMGGGHEPSMNCWCAPELEMLCPACMRGGGFCSWCRGSGYVEASITEAQEVHRVIHRMFDDE